MDQSAMDSPVTLVIKAPNQKYDDQTINCFLNWTVEKLKAHLSRVYPSKPQDEYHMVHLVCTSRTPPSSPVASSSNQRKGTSGYSSNSSSGTSSVATPPSSQESLIASSNSGSEGLRRRNLPQTQTNPVQSNAFPYFVQGNEGNRFPVQQGIPVGFPAYTMFSPVQMLWWQQMYARQYYMQYQAAASAQGLPAAPLPAPRTSQPVNPEPVPLNEPPAAPNAPPQDNRPVNQNIQMNAQGGPLMNDEDLNRDWLDWTYTFSRAAILLSIVYFYSSFSRFVMVMGAMLLVYLHQAGWFPFRQDGVQQQGANNPAAEANVDGQEADNNPDLHEMERLMDDGLDDDSGDDAAEDGHAAQEPSFMASAWSFITTFFTSLIPEGPPNVAN
ncbi:homocysteine-responsive endoplasmic reticulum-resident ubiquitin-like domain member 2 protein isoform X2 [Latimeria chalumnae]|uniref:homocysteine-responsive endoplasmic reticulum-resident ubiquitin-like domain member 2 protein isoform X2 n=1 Tax=Latimeria chalumnae TaxID=7897 RepID=UPI0003C117F0|nr:PREDICTED: homocysteine-responsive endoplasmic reticulum-resident ubiquitin-like domain member 2 protein isoform X2 [Latimeria chalumnae]|eukprot:XP_006012828.1 PREDICTED: homocysteine-responsive endoplasmic reticulum-resident ubiquitin-like domain member 2 protein isoform X2 [Latimeria chalumnae]